MKKFLILFFFLFNITYGHDTFFVSTDKDLSQSTKYIYFIQDKNNTFTKENIKTNSNLKPLTNKTIKSALGPYWTKMKLKNISKKSIDLAIYNNLPGTNYVDVFVYENDILINTHMLGDLRDIKQREVPSTKSMFVLKTKPNQIYTIIAKIENASLNELDWKVVLLEKFNQSQVKELFFWGLFFGIFFMYFLYTLISYFVYKDKTYLMIFGYGFFASMYLLAINGVIYYLDLGFNLYFVNLLGWTASAFGVMFLYPFAYFFFEIYSKYTKIAKIFYIMITFYFTVIIFTIYSTLFDAKHLLWLIPTVFLGHIITVITLFTVGIYMIIKKELGSRYYLIAQGLILFAIITYTFALVNIIDFEPIHNHIIAIAMTIDCFFFLYIQYQKNRQRQKELENSKKVMIENSRFHSIGKAIGNITHQWKHPLSQLGSGISAMEFEHQYDKNSFEKNFEKDIKNVKRSIQLMQNTIDQFTQFYSKKLDIKDFYPKNILNDIIINILNHKIKDIDVNITVNCKDELTINSYEHIFSNIMIILIDNSLDAFSKDITNKNIEIYIDKIDNNINILYKDNAGGIKIKPIEKVFEYFESSKGEKGNGFGLAIAKALIIEQLKGKIHLKNKDDGVEFKISF